MPFRQVLILGKQTVSTGSREPVRVCEIRGCQRYAGGDQNRAFRVVSTAALFQVQQIANDIGKVYLPCLLVLEFLQTTFCTAVAERFPLFTGYFVEGMGLPEGVGVFGNRWMLHDPAIVRLRATPGK